MDSETKRTLITCATSVICILVSNFFIFLNSKSNESKNKQVSILEQQYTMLFSPIHRILFFSKLENEEKINKIYDIIFSNYNLSTELLRSEYKICMSNKKITADFKEIIEDGCQCLEKSLGYTKTKLSKRQKERLKSIIYSGYRSKKISILFFLINTTGLIVATITFILKENIQNNMTDLLAQKNIAIITILIVAWLMIIILIKYVQNNKYF